MDILFGGVHGDLNFNFFFSLVFLKNEIETLNGSLNDYHL